MSSTENLDKVLELLAAKIIKRIGQQAPYTISSSRNLRDDADVVLISGNPVKVYVSHLFILDCLLTKKPHRLNDRIERGLEKTKVCYKSLSNYQIIGYRESVALLKDAKQWIRSSSPDAYIDKVSSIFFKKQYSVTVTDSLTNISITQSGSDISKIESEAVRRLIHMVEEDQEQEEVRQMLITKKEPLISPMKQPKEITISGKDRVQIIGQEIIEPKIIEDEDGHKTLVQSIKPINVKAPLRDENFTKVEYKYEGEEKKDESK